MTDLADLADGLQHADFVVSGHDGDEDGLVVNGALEVFEIDETVCLYGQIGDAVAVFLEALTGVEHGLVLSDLGDDVVAALAIHLRDALDGEVVALSGAGGEDDLLGGGADEPGDLFARGLDGLLGFPAEAVVAAGGVAELASEIRHHCLQHSRIERGGGVIIHIDRQLDARRHFHLGLDCAHRVSILVDAARPCSCGGEVTLQR